MENNKKIEEIVSCILDGKEKHFENLTYAMVSKINLILNEKCMCHNAYIDKQFHLKGYPLGLTPCIHEYINMVKTISYNKRRDFREPDNLIMDVIKITKLTSL